MIDATFLVLHQDGATLSIHVLGQVGRARVVVDLNGGYNENHWYLSQM